MSKINNMINHDKDHSFAYKIQLSLFSKEKAGIWVAEKGKTTPICHKYHFYIRHVFHNLARGLYKFIKNNWGY